MAVGDGAAVRSGEDSRRRGWYWHWNELVTQYAPLLGLKGVGLLNSYTVWTDRREASPHQGYAFPSQQSEADFYGEDRAELITINKILVALDLIEIRKEMVLRTDPLGRRWRVPHNLYRVKDHPDGFTISTREALRVAALADRDKAVYRYVRRVFSPRFAAIDADNPWHQILPELRQTDLWQRLSERTASEETRASARTRAGHAARRVPSSALPVPSEEEAVVAEDEEAEVGIFTGDDGVTSDAVGNDSGTVAKRMVMGTFVAPINNGLERAVAGTNTGSLADGATFVASANGGAPTAVALTNTTYDQNDFTTTTTECRGPSSEFRNGPETDDGDLRPLIPSVDRAAESSATPPSTRSRQAPAPVTSPSALGPRNSPLATHEAFAAANDRPTTPAERNLLCGLAERFDLAALAAAELDPAAPESGWGWVSAAIYEAVEAGSAFVAPRRLREILTRWEREGYPRGDDGSAVGGRRSAERRVGGQDGSGASRRLGVPARASDRRPPTSDQRASDPQARNSALGPRNSVDLPLPHGHGSRRTWEYVVGSLATTLGRDALTDLVAGTAIVGYHDGEITLAAPDPVQADRLATTHRALIERKLAAAMRRPVRLAVVSEGRVPSPESQVTGGETSTTATTTTTPAAPGRPPRDLPRGSSITRTSDLRPPTSPFPVAECGLASDQVWAAALAEVEGGDGLSRANVDAWLRGTVLLGRGGEEVRDPRSSSAPPTSWPSAAWPSATCRPCGPPWRRWSASNCRSKSPSSGTGRDRPNPTPPAHRPPSPPQIATWQADNCLSATLVRRKMPPESVDRDRWGRVPPRFRDLRQPSADRRVRDRWLMIESSASRWLIASESPAPSRWRRRQRTDASRGEDRLGWD